jgi:hypothetical protein
VRDMVFVSVGDEIHGLTTYAYTLRHSRGESQGPWCYEAQVRSC